MPLTNIDTVTTLPAAPQRGEDQDTFVSKANAFVAAQVTLATELNTSIGQMNTLGSEIEGIGNQVSSDAQGASNAVTSAENARDLAQQWANKDENVVVSGGEYSAKHYSIKSEGFKNTAEVAAAAAQSAAGLPSLAGKADYALKVNDSEDGVQWEQLPSPHPANVQSYVKTDTSSTTSTTWVDTGLSVTITLTDAAHRVRLMAAINGCGPGAMMFRFMRGATVVGIGDTLGSRESVSFVVGEASQIDVDTLLSGVGLFVDAPGDVGPHTYKLQWRVINGTGYINRGFDDSNDANSARTISTLEAMEVI